MLRQSIKLIQHIKCRPTLNWDIINISIKIPGHPYDNSLYPLILTPLVEIYLFNMTVA